MATIAVPSEAALWTCLLEAPPIIECIESVRSHPIARNVFDDSAWRIRALNALDTQQVQALAPGGKDLSVARSVELERQIIAVLNSDGRATATAIVTALGKARAAFATPWRR